MFGRSRFAVALRGLLRGRCPLAQGGKKAAIEGDRSTTRQYCSDKPENLMELGSVGSVGSVGGDNF